MVRESLAIATRIKHLEVILGLSRTLGKDWEQVTKEDADYLRNAAQTIMDSIGCSP